MSEAHSEAAALLSMIEANRILRDAGWTPVRSVVAVGGQPVPNAEGLFAFSNLVCGHPPLGSTATYAGKELTKIPQAMAEQLGLDPADYPDEHHEAAAWLVAHFAPNTLTTEATLEPIHLALDSEAGEDSGYEDVRSIARNGDVEAPVWAGDNAPENEAGEGGLLGEPSDEPAADGDGWGADEAVGLADGDETGLQQSGILDADFEESPSLGAELLEDDDFALAELPAPEPEDFAPEEIEPAPSGAFIFGDNLAHDRLVRIGQLTEHANTLLDAAKVGYSDAEHDAVRSHVVTHMNAAGAYVGDNPKLFGRFIELETVTARVRRIEMYRDERQEFIRSALHEAVAAFDPSQGWP